MIKLERKAYLQFGEWGGPYQTVGVELYEKPLKNVKLPALGYGSKIPTQYMVDYEGRKRRVYTAIYSNNGTTYCFVRGEKIIVSIDY